MKTLIKKITLLLLTVFAFSCSSDNSSETKLEKRKNLLLKATDSDGLISIYSYDSNFRLLNYKLNGNANNSSRDYNFNYNSDGTLNTVTQAVGGAIIDKYIYDSNKKIIGKENNDNKYIYKYDGNTITEDYRSVSTNTGWRQVYTYDDKGNISNEKSYSETSDATPLGTYSGVINYTYDDKTNSNSSLPKEFVFPNSVNNIKTTQYNTGSIYPSEYEYNADGYPTKRTDSFTRMYEYQQL